MPQSQATATLPRAPSARATSFHPVPLQSVQFSSAMSCQTPPTFDRAAKSCAGAGSSPAYLDDRRVTAYEPAPRPASHPRGTDTFLVDGSRPDTDPPRRLTDSPRAIYSFFEKDFSIS